MSKDTLQIVPIKLSELVIDNSLSGRSEKEIRDNAKALLPMLDAVGGWDPNQPGQFFVRGGKKHLAAGFTRTAAALLGGYKEGYFIERPDDRSSLRISCITSNAGQPVSQFEQGRIYAAMRDGDDPTKLSKGQEILAPMAPKDIAAAVGYTRQHVEKCICVFSSPPEIAELIQSEQISPNIVARAAQLVKDEGKRVKFLKAAVKVAKAEGKETATLKHLDAVRPEFAPLKAAKKEDPATADESKEPKNTESEPDSKPDTKPETKKVENPELTGLADLGAAKSTEPKAKDDKKEGDDEPSRADLEPLEFAVAKWADDTDTVVDDSDITTLAAIMFERGAR
jgi:hypothetical protein